MGGRMIYPIMKPSGSHHYICEGNLYRKYRNGRDEYVFVKKLDENDVNISDDYFNEIEDDFRLLHKPLGAN